MSVSNNLCSLQPDETAHPYSRSGAVAYAHQYALQPNLDYYYFPDAYGDCTNFVSQAVYHGSSAQAVGSGTFGWYYGYFNDFEHKDYSAAWTHVQYLYGFITEYYVWDKGPEGCEIPRESTSSALAGDLVQMDWNSEDDTWNHSVIIVRKITPPDGPDNPLYYVAGHSDDVDYYPLTAMPGYDLRFVRIERIDGEIRASRWR